MPCSYLSINKNFKCDKPSCICIPTAGKPCICLCENQNGDLIVCDNCKCSTDSCQCQCDNSKCTCIVTKGANCICVCRDETGNFKTCDCSCTELPCCKEPTTTGMCCMKLQKDCIKLDSCQPKCNDPKCTCIATKSGCVRVCRNERGIIKKCDCSCTELDEENPCCKERARIEKIYKCEQAGCVCIPTGGKLCICICENAKGNVVKCDDCKCSINCCQTNCEDHKCTCIATKGADCICVCRDVEGNFKTCDYSCTELACCENIPTTSKSQIDCMKSNSCQPKCNNSKCDCIATKSGCVRMCCHQRGIIKKCDCSCTKLDEGNSCCKERLNNNQKKNVCLKKPSKETPIVDEYRCEKAGCVCVPTGGKPCICICKNAKGDIVKCDDCKCSINCCQINCEDPKCTCIVTKGADCICVCRDVEGNFKTCDYPCTELACSKNIPTTSKSQIDCMKSDGCQPKCNNCKCDCIATKSSCVRVCCHQRGIIKKCDCSCTKLDEGNSCCKERLNNNQKKNVCLKKPSKETPIVDEYRCEQAGCVCIPTGGKPCICICENAKGDIVKCDDCKCSINCCQTNCEDPKCTCIVTKGADCICVCRDNSGNFKTCGCPCIDLEEIKTCCTEEYAKAESHNCKCTYIFTNTGYLSVCRNERGNIIKCDCSCAELDNEIICCKKEYLKSHDCGKKLESTDHKYDQGKRVCVPTGGKPCICICESEKGEIMRCDDCKCFIDCQCKCDDTKCTCIVTEGAACICVCKDKTGNIKTCDCSCSVLKEPESRYNKNHNKPGKGCLTFKKYYCTKCDGHKISHETSCTDLYKATSCCKKECESYNYSKDEDKGKCGICCKGDRNKNGKVVQFGVTASKNYKCKQSGSICIATSGNVCTCGCDDEKRNIIRCSVDSCHRKSNDDKCSYIINKGADCVCVCRDERENFKKCNCSCTDRGSGQIKFSSKID